jgi:hypothetical protein
VPDAPVRDGSLPAGRPAGELPPVTVLSEADFAAMPRRRPGRDHAAASPRHLGLVAELAETDPAGALAPQAMNRPDDASAGDLPG